MSDAYRKFGSPPQNLPSWLSDFYKETDAARKRSLNPLKRIWFRGRMSGIDSAFTLWMNCYQDELTTVVPVSYDI